MYSLPTLLHRLHFFWKLYNQKITHFLFFHRYFFSHFFIFYCYQARHNRWRSKWRENSWWNYVHWTMSHLSEKNAPAIWLLTPKLKSILNNLDIINYYYLFFFGLFCSVFTLYFCVFLFLIFFFFALKNSFS